MTSNTSSITPRSFRRPFRESHHSYWICNATWQQPKLTTDCIQRRLDLLGSPISCSQLKAESWTAGSPEHKTQWQVDARIYTQPWTATMNYQNSNGMLWFSQLLTWETNWNYMRRAASILRIAKREQFGTGKTRAQFVNKFIHWWSRKRFLIRGRRNLGYESTAFKRDDAVPWHETVCSTSKCDHNLLVMWKACVHCIYMK